MLNANWDELPSVESVELPCFISSSSKEKAFSMLGGKDATLNSVRHGMKTLRFQFPGQSTVKSGIDGTRNDAMGLVLKVRKGSNNSKRKGSSSSGSNKSAKFDVEFLGRVENSYRFNNPADFQFLPSITYADASSGGEVDKNEVFKAFCPLYVQDADNLAIVRESGTGKKIILDARPSDFMHRDKSVTTAHADGLFSTEVVLDEPTSNYERKKVKSVAYVLNGGDPIPTAPKQEHVIKRAQRNVSKYTHNQVISQYKLLLELRPVWAKRMLDLHAMFRDAGQMHFFKTLLPYYSFYYKSGPMKDLWCKFGYDPAADPSSRLYQVINVRLTSANWMQIKNKITKFVGGNQSSTHAVNLDTGLMEHLNGQRLDEITTTGRMDLDKSSVPLIMFGTLIKRQFAVQVVGCMDENFVTFVKEAQVLQKWDTLTGWYSEKTLKLMRQWLLERLNRKVDELVSKPIQYTNKSCILVTGETNPHGTEHGYDQSIFDWQTKYLALPVQTAASIDAMLANEEKLNLMLSPEYRERIGHPTSRAPRPRSAGDIYREERRHVPAGFNAALPLAESASTARKFDPSNSTPGVEKVVSAVTNVAPGVPEDGSSGQSRDKSITDVVRVAPKNTIIQQFVQPQPEPKVPNPVLEPQVYNQTEEERFMKSLDRVQGFSAYDVAESESEEEVEEREEEE